VRSVHKENLTLVYRRRTFCLLQYDCITGHLKYQNDKIAGHEWLGHYRTLLAC